MSIARIMQSVIKTTLLPSYSFFSLDIKRFSLKAGEELGIRIGKEVFILSKDEQRKIDLFKGLRKKPLPRNDENHFIIEDKTKNYLLWVFPTEEGVQIGGGNANGGVTIFSKDVIGDIRRSKNKIREDDFTPSNHYRIGALYNPSSGHVIDGAVYFLDSSNGIKGPFLSVDFEQDVELRKAYKNIKEKIVLDELTKEEEILKTVYDYLKRIKYLEDSPKTEKLKEIKRLLRIGPLVFRLGGICCYQAFTVCAILEKLILERLLEGKIFYANGKGHGWPLYLSSNEELFIVDTTQSNFFNLTKEKDRTFYGFEEKDGKEIDGRFKYLDFLTLQTIFSSS
ncbi:MAG: hypothetical protein HY094_07835 [Candidatus Melainabacteria bacterium]|nr:hypothetical protein [Candidatus Melainabacteria bacterium]